MSGPYAKIIADSLHPNGKDRLTTMEVRFHRFVLAEFNTHRVFSRNSASSRAIPVRKQIERVRNDPAIPLSFPVEQKGMQGGEEVENADQIRAYWRAIAGETADRVEGLAREQRVHKSVLNRLLEPFLWHTVIVSATDWDGFWKQRVSPLAQPEIRVAAEKMLEAYRASEPTKLEYGDWHLPYIDKETDGYVERLVRAHASPQNYRAVYLEMLKGISAARCARVSYLTHDGDRDVVKDMELAIKLKNADPMHSSPFEHVATPDDGPTRGNFTGFVQYRHQLEF